jgi:hypothetical protein
VPAPPEVAMRMMREQGGGPPPYDSSNGGPPAIGGRKAGMLGVAPVIGGSAPLITMPPTFQQDPRRIRRFHHPHPHTKMKKTPTFTIFLSCKCVL